MSRRGLEPAALAPESSHRASHNPNVWFREKAKHDVRIGIGQRLYSTTREYEEHWYFFTLSYLKLRPKKFDGVQIKSQIIWHKLILPPNSITFVDWRRTCHVSWAIPWGNNYLNQEKMIFSCLNFVWCVSWNCALQETVSFVSLRPIIMFPSEGFDINLGGQQISLFPEGPVMKCLLLQIQVPFRYWN